MNSQPPILPSQGQSTLDALIAAIANAPRLLGVEDVVVVRSVVVNVAADDWFNFATSAFVGCRRGDSYAGISDIDLGKVRLIRSEFRATEVTNREILRSMLSTWKQVIGRGSGLALGESVLVDRWASRNDWASEPCWVVELQEAGSQVTGAPHGPFFHADTRFFAENIGGAAVQWVGDPGLKQETTTKLNAR